MLLLKIWLALGLDGLWGDPKWFPHPVRLMGKLAVTLEAPMRRHIKNQKSAGLATAVLVIGTTVGVTWAMLGICYTLSVWAGHVVSVGLFYFCFAARDLADHALAVKAALDENDLAQARQQVAMIVGRDVNDMDEAAIARAAVESVAESAVDGVVAPLFYAVLLGPAGAMAYKAINTLDSTFGYKNEQYRAFGWASARIDDAANFIPARLGLVFTALAAWFFKMDAKSAFQLGLRDAKKHKSPNAGYAEAAFAGALNIRLGGPVMRYGKPDNGP